MQKIETSRFAMARRLAAICVAAFTIAVIATSAATAQGDSVPFAKPGENSAMISGAVGRRAQFIYPVHFIEINGQNIHPREFIWLEPGEYELTVRALVTDPPGLSSTSRFRDSGEYNRITVVLEAGKNYWIGMKYDQAEPARSPNAVLYRVEEN